MKPFIKQLLQEVLLNLAKLGIVAGIGALSNIVIHHYTDNHVLNAIGVGLATGASALVKTKT